MKKEQNFKLVFLFLVLAITGCVHTGADKDLDQRVKDESAMTDSRQLENKSIDLISTMPNLTNEQRERLSKLKIDTSLQMRNLDQKSIQLRSVLLTDLSNTVYDKKEIDLIKKRIKKVENLRMTKLFDAVEKASSILGRTSNNTPELMEKFWFEHDKIRN